MIFKRRKGGQESEETESDVAPETTRADAEFGHEAVGDEPAAYDRSDGPFDVSEVDADAQRLDVGSLLIPMIEGLEIRLEVDQQSGQPVAVTLVRGEGAVQVRAFAGPRSGGTWGEALREVSQQITRDGGTVDQVEGPFGTELRATVPAQDERGRRVMQPIRFVGVDGPRWMLQGVLLGEGAHHATAGALEEVYRALVVVRGTEAMPKGAQLPVKFPETLPDDIEAEEVEEIDQGEDGFELEGPDDHDRR